ncbi:hypothetical protein A1342_21325 [Methylomonas methanica]|uniref:Uncharacterized protein n=1 Tax=Methylomonas denitrificans TaxID=1538553 RepID=A0A140E555_9GAMM|nr:hypothetical protein [Methylomonas denitrificans]AMK75529.1 hypothetical protein JT25_003325 [Methylomonas denitrificans]OAI01844.1 hypothetical protein A1342_21325 [Methylomonas methanica]
MSLKKLKAKSNSLGAIMNAGLRSLLPRRLGTQLNKMAGISWHDLGFAVLAKGAGQRRLQNDFVDSHNKALCFFIQPLWQVLRITKRGFPDELGLVLKVSAAGTHHHMHSNRQAFA